MTKKINTSVVKYVQKQDKTVHLLVMTKINMVSFCSLGFVPSIKHFSYTNRILRINIWLVYMAPMTTVMEGGENERFKCVGTSEH